jgi:hypothetical protein
VVAEGPEVVTETVHQVVDRFAVEEHTERGTQGVVARVEEEDPTGALVSEGLDVSGQVGDST